MKRDLTMVPLEIKDFEKLKWYMYSEGNAIPKGND